jgi:phage terminase small subunit
MDPKAPTSPPKLTLALPGQPQLSLQPRPEAKAAAAPVPQVVQADPEEAGEECTPRELAFVKQYLVDFNAEKAMIRVGYSEVTARASNARLLARPRVRAAILRELDAILGPLDALRRRVATELVQLAFADKSGAVDEFGNFLPLSQWPEGLRKSISEISKTVSQTGSETTRYKFESKTQALAMLREILGMDPPKRVDITSGGEPVKSAATVSYITIAGVQVPVPTGG